MGYCSLKASQFPLLGVTASELTRDRPGLLFEILSILSNHCNAIEAKVWTHNARMASIIYTPLGLHTR
ncbi:hypothetical protein AMTR_s00012p00093960 [Amborella trichopoda]|uniref:ACT domain-containing protein n=1 Tax=Amborella trichopoda TaxID=13333 RepID=W1PJ51_AMBTC|nr:hypothetical protein AMTR_s00012p00093960 [Amborella trichopoda]